MGLKDSFRKALAREEDEETVLVPRREVLEVPIQLLVANPRSKDVRFAEVGMEEIVAGYRKTGRIEPVVTRRLPDGKFLIVAGESRVLAAKHLGLEKVPCFVPPPRKR